MAHEQDMLWIVAITDRRCGLLSALQQLLFRFWVFNPEGTVRLIDVSERLGVLPTSWHESDVSFRPPSDEALGVTPATARTWPSSACMARLGQLATGRAIL